MRANKRRPKRARRAINGAAMGIPEAATEVGVTEKAFRAQVARRRVPYRKMGGRIVFLRSELKDWLKMLPGLSLDELQRNRQERA